MAQALSLVGAALVLGAFAGLQLGRLSPVQRRYQVANLVGAALLCASALMTQTWGFVILNLVWAGFALATLTGVVAPDASARTPTPPRA